MQMPLKSRPSGGILTVRTVNPPQPPQAINGIGGDFMYENNTRKERAVLACVNTGEFDAEASLAELAELADTAGAEVLGEFLQNRETPDTAAYLGEGKLREIREFCRQQEADLLILDDELSGTQIRNIEEITGVHAIDRTTLILDIFARRARSREGRIQVELAQQKYRLPRLTGLGKQLSRLGGGIGTRGPGESKLESDRRHIRRRIDALEAELAALGSSRARVRKRRAKNGAITAAIVGYTNVGKSTILNLLTSAEVYVQDQLFATLDPTARELTLPNGQRIILVDTVGLIQRLPHQLVEAFHSTLEEAADADLILNVCDCSNPAVDRQLEVTRQLLDELGCGGIPTITVYNKVDLCPDAERLIGNDRTVFISAKERKNLDGLLRAMETALSEKMRRVTLEIPYSDGAVRNLLRERGHVFREEFLEDRVRIEANVDEKILKFLLPYRV